MARLSFRDRFFTAPVARSIMSPLGLLLFGGVSAGSILAGIPVVGSVAIGLAAWAAKVGLSIPRDKQGQRIDPYTLSEPWRQYVMAAQSAKLRFDRTVGDTREGAIKEHLSSMASRLDEGLANCWRIASRGDDIDGALSNLNTAQASMDLAQALRQAEVKGATPTLNSTISSLQAQVQSAQRMQAVSQDARDKLQALDARLDELVARAAEVSIGASDSGILSDDVDGLVTELESLRQALEITDKIGPSKAAALPTPPAKTTTAERNGQAPSPPGSNEAGGPQTWPPAT